jgi:hypothetical protein
MQLLFTTVSTFMIFLDFYLCGGGYGICHYFEKNGITVPSLLEKYIPFTHFCTIPSRMRSQISVFISVGFVSIQLLTQDSGFKLGFGTRLPKHAGACILNKEVI